jgi:hypothetical protein
MPPPQHEQHLLRHPTPFHTKQRTEPSSLTTKKHRQQCKIAWQQHVRQTLQRLRKSDNLFLDDSITTAEDERINLAKNDATNAKCKAINLAPDTCNKLNISLMQRGCNTAYSMSAAFNRTFKQLNKTTLHVSFASHNSMRLFNNHTEPIIITYNSGTNGSYISERDLVNAGLPILGQSTRKVGVANGGTSLAKHVTRLPFNKLSACAWQADTFQDFPMSLMSVCKTANNGTVSVFTKTGITVYKKEDVLITCKGEPILIRV